VHSGGHVTFLHRPARLRARLRGSRATAVRLGARPRTPRMLHGRGCPEVPFALTPRPQPTISGPDPLFPQPPRCPRFQSARNRVRSVVRRGNNDVHVLRARTDRDQAPVPEGAHGSNRGLNRAALIRRQGDGNARAPFGQQQGIRSAVERRAALIVLPVNRAARIPVQVTGVGAERDQVRDGASHTLPSDDTEDWLR
jgi:hypothetical protein